MTITEELARALRLTPCRCGWVKDEKGQRVETKCSRCLALDRFDIEFSEARSGEYVQ